MLGRPQQIVGRVDGRQSGAGGAGQLQTRNEKVFALGQKLRITGTPAIIFADGTRIAGAIDTAGLEAKLKTVK